MTSISITKTSKRTFDTRSLINSHGQISLVRQTSLHEIRFCRERDLEVVYFRWIKAPSGRGAIEMAIGLFSQVVFSADHDIEPEWFALLNEISDRTKDEVGLDVAMLGALKAVGITVIAPVAIMLLTISYFAPHRCTDNCGEQITITSNMDTRNELRLAQP